MRTLFAVVVVGTVASTAASAQINNAISGACRVPAATVTALQATLSTVVRLPDGNGGIFKPNLMWSAVVDRAGHLCSVQAFGDAWPGSRAIAISKAETGMGFSNVKLSLSTANLFAAVQPGNSLYGLNTSNLFNPDFIDRKAGGGEIPAGVITFGGGFALYQNGRVIGGLGVSGDTACADHSIAYRMRKLAGLDGIPGGVGPNGTDNILYAAPGVAPVGFEHPHCGATDLTADQIANVP